MVTLPKLHELTWEGVRDLLKKGVDTVILPVGTIEPHGTHLPLGTDAIIPEAIGEKLANRLGAVLLPTIHYGVTRSLHGYPGSVRVEPGTLENLVFEVLSSMAEHGFKYAVIINGHGGSEQVQALSRAAFRLWTERRMAVAIVDWWALAREKGVTMEVLGKEGGHAGTDETVAVLAVRPDLVREEAYRESEIVVYTRGFRTYPLHGTVINYSEGEGNVVFSREKAEEYLERVAALIEKEVRVFLERTRELLG